VAGTPREWSALVAALWLMWRVGRWVGRPDLSGVTVDSAGQPELFALVGEVGDRLGAGPDRIVLVGSAEFQAWAAAAEACAQRGLPA
jgi:hypothetical protein